MGYQPITATRRANGAYNVCVGLRAGAALTTESHCTFIGIDAGADMVGVDGVTIIGDGIRDLDPDHNSPNVLFIGRRVAIGDTLFGQPMNLKVLIGDFLRSFGVPVELERPIT